MKAKPGNFQPAVLLSCEQLKRSLQQKSEFSNYHSAGCWRNGPTEGNGAAPRSLNRDYRALPLWSDYGSYSCCNDRAPDCIYGCNSSKYSAELHSNNSANVLCPLIHGPRHRVHTQLCSGGLSSIQLSLGRGNLLDCQDNTKLRTEGDGLIYKT